MKDRKQMEARRRAKTTSRAKRGKQYVAPPKPKRPLPATATQEDPIEALKNVWFMLHGMNYLNSDYATGTWQPLYDVYADDLTEMPPIRQVFSEVCAKHYNEETKTWTDHGQLLAAWMMVAPETMRGIRMALLSHLAAEDNVEQAANELVKPHHPAVWAFFHDQIVSRLAKSEEEAPAVAGTEPSGEGGSLDDGDSSPVEEAP